MELIVPCEFDANPGTFALVFREVQAEMAIGTVRIVVQQSGVDLLLPFSVTRLGLRGFMADLDQLIMTHQGVARLCSPPIPHQAHGIWIIRRARWYDGRLGQSLRFDICGAIVVGKSGQPAVEGAEGHITYDYQDMSMRYEFDGLKIDAAELLRIRATTEQFVAKHCLGDDTGPR
jgi:hypothetical protein